MQHILYRWVRYVESTGNEVGMTLLIGGTTISGILTSALRYDDWLKEVMYRAQHEGGMLSLPDVEMLPITEETSQRVRDAWMEAGIPEPESPDDPLGPGCVLRNAEVRPPGPAMQWRTYPYLMVQVSAVDAILPASTEGKTLPRR